MKTLLATEYGWPGSELRILFSSAPAFDLSVVHRSRIPEDVPDLASFGLVLTYGPHYGRLGRFLQALEAARVANPDLKAIWWLNENLPDFRHPAIARLIGSARRLSDDVLDAVAPQREVETRLATTIGHRYRIFDALYQANRRNLFDVIAVTSGYRGRELAKLGIPTLHMPMGWGPSTDIGEMLMLQRDVDVLFLGTLSSMRPARRAKVERVREDLARHGIPLTVITGGLTVEERTRFLNRTRILLNLLRSPEDWTGHRLLLGAANGAMLLSEPMVDREPFVADQHIIFRPIEDMAETIVAYLKDELARRKIADSAYEMMHKTLTMQACLQRILNAAGVHASLADP